LCCSLKSTNTVSIPSYRTEDWVATTTWAQSEAFLTLHRDDLADDATRGILASASAESS